MNNSYSDFYFRRPDCNGGSDKDSGDESGGKVTNLSGRHPQAGASLFSKVESKMAISVWNKHLTL